MITTNVKRKRKYYDKTQVKLARAVDRLVAMTDREILQLLGKDEPYIETEVIIVDNEPHYVDIVYHMPEIPIVIDDIVNNPYSDAIPLTYDEMQGL